MVIGIFYEANERTLLPFLEHERAGTDRRVIVRVGLEVGAFVQMLGNHRQRADLEDAEERSERLFQCEHHGEIIGRFNLFKLYQIGPRPRMGLLAHFDREQNVGRRKRLAVMPIHARLELEGVDLGVLADSPAFGEAGQRLQFRAVAQQTFKDIAGHHLGRAVLDHGQHQAGRLGLDHGIDDTSHLLLLRGRNAGAAGQNEAKHDFLQHDLPFAGGMLRAESPVKAGECKLWAG